MDRVRTRAWITATALLLVAGCSTGQASQTSSTSPAAVSAVPVQDAPSSPSPDDLIGQRVAAMTLDQKVGQLFMVALQQDAPVETLQPMIAGGQVGGVVLLGDEWTMDQATATTAALASYAAGQPGIFLAVDQEGGQVQHLNGAGFSVMPPATDQGAMAPSDLTAQATAWGAELHQAGINLDLAPTVDTVPVSMLDTNQPIAHYHRQFGSDPVQVGEHSAAFVAGMNASGVHACLKHFPGLGYVTGNTDITADGIVDNDTTRGDANMAAFATAISAGPSMVMVSSATYAQIDAGGPAVFSSIMITQVLRGDLGWQGVVISDTLSAKSVAAWTPGQRAIGFIAAGGDIALFTDFGDAQSAIADVTSTAASDPAFAAQVDAAVTRVLLAKQAAGLLPG
ncbi:MAG: glycoside hydrolase family 3 [Propionibacteriaceae bacterium]|nr:glycoside hydrolase family 3 [Propionibacteriaceae bacterium]